MCILPKQNATTLSDNELTLLYYLLDTLYLRFPSELGFLSRSPYKYFNYIWGVKSDQPLLSRICHTGYVIISSPGNSSIYNVSAWLLQQLPEIVKAIYYADQQHRRPLRYIFKQCFSKHKDEFKWYKKVEQYKDQVLVGLCTMPRYFQSSVIQKLEISEEYHSTLGVCFLDAIEYVELLPICTEVQLDELDKMLQAYNQGD